MRVVTTSVSDVVTTSLSDVVKVATTLLQRGHNMKYLVSKPFLDFFETSFNPLQSGVAFLCPLKTSEYLGRFFDVFKE